MGKGLEGTLASMSGFEDRWYTTPHISSSFLFFYRHVELWCAQDSEKHKTRESVNSLLPMLAAPAVGPDCQGALIWKSGRTWDPETSDLWLQPGHLVTVQFFLSWI